MSELALAVFASETGTHLVRPPTGARWAEFAAPLRREGVSRRPRRARLPVRRALGADFPPLLRAIHDPPAGLFVRGSALELLAQPAVAVVGARACSATARRCAELARELAAAGLVVVSGLARGIDAEAHRGALDAGGRRSPSSAAGSTATIRRRMPSSRDASPRAASSSRSTRRESSPPRGGFRRATESSPDSALATVVVEARERSGALITADLALEEGREVFTVPGEITSALSAGTNDLLKLGASPLTSAGRPSLVRHRPDVRLPTPQNN